MHPSSRRGGTRGESRCLGCACPHDGKRRLTFNDIGNWIDDSERTYSEEELQEYGQAHRAEGVEAGIKIGMARAASNGRGNGHLSLPPPKEMAEFCNDRQSQLKDDAQRKFVTEMFLITRRGLSPQRGSLGYLISIYVKHGGKT